MAASKGQKFGGAVIHMNDVKFVVGSEVVSRTPLRPFSEEAIAFLAHLSKNLLRLPEARRYADITAFGFWCRKANLQSMETMYPDALVRLGRGLCLHIAPGNVPINFVFSYAFGLLAGCSNLVRLPSKQFPQVDIVCREIAALLPQYPEIAARTAMVRYPASDEITAHWSRQADARIIWGGDSTVASLKGWPSSPRCVDVCFADRYSLCLLNPKAIEQAEEQTIESLAEQFYNDTYLMDQNACSSPQLVVWTEDSQNGRTRFWDAVFQVAKRQYSLQDAVSVDKYTQLLSDILCRDAVCDVWKRENILYGVELSSLPEDVTELRGKGGYFYEYMLQAWSELEQIVTEKYQTLTYFGLDAEEIRRFIIEHCLRGIDRVVPVGKALDIGIVWDGYDLVRTLSRQIEAV